MASFFTPPFSLAASQASPMLGFEARRLPKDGKGRCRASPSTAASPIMLADRNAASRAYGSYTYFHDTIICSHLIVNYRQYQLDKMFVVSKKQTCMAVRVIARRFRPAHLRRPGFA